MKLLTCLFAPVALLGAMAPALADFTPAPLGVLAEEADASKLAPAEPAPHGITGAWHRLLARLHPTHAAPAHQVSIVQRFSIRISPGGPMMPQDVMVELQQDEIPARYTEHKMGKCILWSDIDAVQGAMGNRLVLFMRDQHIVSAELDKNCEARDFYSGFLFSRTADGQICVGRDILQSRSGANCKMRRLRDLVQVADHRAP